MSHEQTDNQQLPSEKTLSSTIPEELSSEELSSIAGGSVMAIISGSIGTTIGIGITGSMTTAALRRDHLKTRVAIGAVGTTAGAIIGGGVGARVGESLPKNNQQ